MQRLIFRGARVFVASLLLLLMPAMVLAQSEQLRPGAPPVGQPVVSEGDFAVRLAFALAVVTTEDEVEAESRLGEIGIAPRNGWIADYPVTPDIVAELQDAVSEAAASNRLSLSKDEALNRLTAVVVEFGLSVRPYIAGATYEPTAESCANYPNPTVINNSYTSEGPPVVTYYCPPPDYYNMYTWVPYPFWWSDLWFPGFFILHDFHRVVHVQKRVVVIRNHFNDVRTNRAFRIDPVERFRGRTFAGIGVSRPKNFIPTGVPRSERTIFNGPRAKRMPAGVTISPPSRGGERIIPAPRGGERIVPPTGDGRISPRSGGGGSRGREERR
jgi:hypothetical protein